MPNAVIAVINASLEFYKLKKVFICNVSCVTSHVSCVTCDFKWLGLFEEGLLSTGLLRLVFRNVLPTWNPNQRC